MTANILDGNAIAQAERHPIAAKIKERQKSGHRAPGLAVILVGQDPASQLYVQNKRLACEEVGILSESFEYPDTITENVLLEKIDELNHAPHIDGILVQLPLPDSISTDNILRRIRPEKDVDGFHALNLGKLIQNQPGLRPCTPMGIMTLLSHTSLSLPGCRACVVGASRIVGRPMAIELLNQNATVTICHKMTQSLPALIQEADLVVVAIGVPQFIRGEWIKEGAVVIDVGINRTPEGKIVGDVCFEEAREKASWITPVPGGVGPMTIVSLLQNTLLASTLNIQS